MEFNKDTVKVGQQWERADGKVATVLGIDDRYASVSVSGSFCGVYYYYTDGGKSNIHATDPQTQLIRLLPDLDETAKAQIDKDEDDATPAEQETETQKQDTEVQEQDVTVVSRFSNSVHNYPPLGHAVVYINSLQIEVDFGKRKLIVQDNAGPTYATPAPIAARNYEPLSNL